MGFNSGFKELISLLRTWIQVRNNFRPFHRNKSTGTAMSTSRSTVKTTNLLKPTGYVMHHQFNIQQPYALPTLYLCVLYLSENKQRLAPLTA